MEIKTIEIGELKDQVKEFDYGIVEITDFKNQTRTIYKSCLRCCYVEKIKNFEGYKYWEFQLLYRDDDFKIQCLCIDKSKHNDSIKLIYKGQMLVEL